MTEKEIFTDFEIEQLKCKRNLDYSLSQIRIICKVILYTSFGMILITIIIVFMINTGFLFGVV